MFQDRFHTAAANLKKYWPWLAALTVSLAVYGAISLTSFFSDCQEVRESVVRLHVLANSDSEADQALKMQVRDAVAAEAAALLSESDSAAQALELAAAGIDRLAQAGQAVVDAAGYDYDVQASVCRMYFPTRRYDDAATLPAGMYDALRVTIGTGEGRNWWCVAFPPLCLSAAADASTLPDVLDGEPLDIVTEPERYEVRLKVVEWWESLCHWVSGWGG